MIGVLLAAALTGLWQPAAPSDAVIIFQFDRPAMHQPGYTFELQRSGRLTYKQGEKNSLTGAADPPLQVSEELAGRIFSQTAEVSYFNYPCASKRRGIADTGEKVLTYKGSDRMGSCTFNYTESKTLQALTDEFQGMATMLEEGRRLDSEHRYDRLALFAEVATLSGLIKDGRAVEVGLIARELQALAGDPDVLEKVRVKAGELLKLAEPVH